jgi:hypothetical protein
MRRGVLAVAAGLILPALASAGDVEPTPNHHEMEAASPNDPPIKITINPEARVSVVLAGALPPPALCGEAAELLVTILNQGFVTSRLEADLVGGPDSVRLDFHPEPLRGVPKELRKLHVTLTQPGPVDLTIAFKTRDEIPDLGGRDRIHFLMRCR